MRAKELGLQNRTEHTKKDWEAGLQTKELSLQKKNWANKTEELGLQRKELSPQNGGIWPSEKEGLKKSRLTKEELCLKKESFFIKTGPFKEEQIENELNL